MSSNDASPGTDAPHGSADQHAQALSEFQTLPVTGSIQFDRFCDHCGYNLRGQPTRRELRTRLILLACPECGTFHPANDTTPLARLWTRVRQIITVGWLAFWLVVWFIASLMYFIPSMILAESFRHWLSGYSSWDNGRYIELVLLLGINAGFIVAAALLFMLLAVIAFPHWNKLGLAILACIWATPGIVIAMLFQASMTYWGESLVLRSGIILATGAVVIATGLASIVMARPIARLVIAMLLPVPWRAHVAHLWIADGLTPPGMRETSAAATK